MELVLVKQKENAKVYQGVLDIGDNDHYFFATVVDGQIRDFIAYTLGEDQTMIPVEEYTKGGLFDVLVKEYIEDGI